jgi:hypothetical protein
MTRPPPLRNSDVMHVSSAKMNRALANRRARLDSIKCALDARNARAAVVLGRKQTARERLRRAHNDKHAAAGRRRDSRLRATTERVALKLQQNNEGVLNMRHAEAVAAVRARTAITVRQRQAELRRAVAQSCRCRVARKLADIQCAVVPR